MTNPATFRAFGRCYAKGCTHRHVTEQLVPGTGSDKGRVLFKTERGTLAHAVAGYFPEIDKMMKAVNLVCPQHGATMRYSALNATYNPEKVCDGRCMNARHADCECACGGENHGKHRVALI